MSLTRNNMKSQVTKLIVTTAVASLLCACATTPPTSLRAMKTQQVKELAMTCYIKQHDAGTVLGYGPIWLACKEWAKKQVQ